MGVFASRSPFRPNPLGLSSVKFERIEHTEKDGDVLIVSGADLLDETPIFDIKPYLLSCDCHTGAKGGYADQFTEYKLAVNICEGALNEFPKDKLSALIGCLEEDPRPSYQNDDREYGMSFAGFNVKFKVQENTLTVFGCEKIDK